MEAFFYLLFPFLIGIPSRRLGWLMAIIVTVQFGAVASGLATKFMTYFFPPSRLVDFVLGILLYRFWCAHKDISPRYVSAAQALALTLLMAAFVLSPAVPQGLRYDLYYAAPMAAVVLSCAWQGGAVSRAVSNRWLVLLGDASFALYMVHQLVIRAGLALWPQGNEVLIAVACFFASLAISILVYLFFEQPAKDVTATVLRRWRDRVMIAMGDRTKVRTNVDARPKARQ